MPTLRRSSGGSMKEMADANKISYLHHLISTDIPVLTKIKDEQKVKQEMEARIQVVVVSYEKAASLAVMKLSHPNSSP
ncbi:hypothetical protein SUGI_0241510 [Cryptomeria japonica]|nr:hypothetical protein SUGI_0241510 [Cryptomeria japonica]